MTHNSASIIFPYLPPHKMESLTHKRLKQLCKERNLSLCEGKETTKPFPLSFLTNTYPDSGKDRIQKENPSLYAAIFPFVPSLPDFRPLETLELMAKTEEGNIPPQNNWLVIERALETLGLEEQQDAATIIISLYEGAVANLEPYLMKKDLLNDILEIYPALTWLAIKAAPTTSLLAVLVASGRIDLIPKEVSVKEMIPWIREREVARYLHEIDPDAIIPTNNLFIEWAKNGELGKVLWGLEDAKARIDPSVQQNHAIREAAANGHLNVVRELMKDERVDPSDKGNIALIAPAVYGYVEVVKELMKDKRVNPSVL